MEAAVSLSDIVSDTPSSSGKWLLTLFPCTRVCPFHGVQSFRNTLFHCGCPMESQGLPQHLIQHGLLSMDLTRSLLQPRLPRGSKTPSGIHLLRWGVLHGLQMDLCSTMALCRLQRDSLTHQGRHHGLQGNLCSDTLSTSSSSFFT